MKLLQKQLRGGRRLSTLRKWQEMCGIAASCKANKGYPGFISGWGKDMERVRELVPIKQSVSAMSENNSRYPWNVERQAEKQHLIIFDQPSICFQKVLVCNLSCVAVYKIISRWDLIPWSWGGSKTNGSITDWLALVGVLITLYLSCLSGARLLVL